MNISYNLSKNYILSGLVKIIIHTVVKVFRAAQTFEGRAGGNEICIINFHKLGDTVFTIPTLLELHSFYKRDFYILCFEETVPIFELFFKREQLIAFKHSDFIFKGRIAKGKIRKKIKELNPVIIYDLTGGLSTATILFNSAAKEIIGISENYFKPIYTIYIPLRKKPHIIDIYLDAIKPIIPVFNESIKEFNCDINLNGYIIIHPFAGWKAKEWGLSKFIKLSEMLKNNYEIILVSESGKINNEVKNEIVNKKIKLIESKDILELIEIIKNCSLIIGNDSGPVYIANLMGKPTFTIYGPTNPDFSLPIGFNHKFLNRKLKCSPKRHTQYCFTDAGRIGCPSFECMHILNVEEVYTSIEYFIKELGIKNRKGSTYLN